MKKFIVLLLLLLTHQALLAYPIVLRENHPTTYTVKPGDTLWEIAEKFLDDPLQWPQLIRTNPDIQGPYQLYAGQVLELNLYNGHPELWIKSGGTIKLKPRVKTMPSQAIETIPLKYIKPFLNSTRIVNREAFLARPYVVAHADEHITTGAGDSIYVMGFADPQHIAENYGLFRLGPAYVSPSTKKVLGFQATNVGEAHLTRPGEPATFEISKANQEVITGVRLLPASDAHVSTDFIPHIPKKYLHGQIIAVLNGTTQIGQYQTVVLDSGKTDGIIVGDIFLVYQNGEVIRNPVAGKKPQNIKLPNERAGTMMVYQSFDKVSYGLILHARRPIHLLDFAISPAATDVFHSDTSS